jgi:hypothetical protein
VSSTTIVAPRVLWENRDEQNGFTNFAGATSVAVFGNLLAVGSTIDNGVALIDITNPQAPVLLSQFSEGQGAFTNIANIFALAMKTNLLIMASIDSNTLTFVSLTNPAAPVKLAQLQDGVGGWNSLAAIYGLAISGNILAIASLGDNAVTLADISNPSAPIKRVEIIDGVFGFNSLSGTVSVAISGNLLAIGAIYDNAVTLVDITDPSNPIKLSELRDGVGGFNNLSNVYQVALSTNGLLAISALSDNTVTLVSVTNPAAPVKLAELTDGVNGIDSLYFAASLAFAGNWLAVSSLGDLTITLFDVSNPSVPRKLAVMRDGVAGFDYLDGIYQMAFAGTNLIVPASADRAVTLIGFGTAPVGLVTQNRVGIGTTQPRAALEVDGDVVVDNALLFGVNAIHVELGASASAVGSNSVALGNNVLANGDSSIAIGSDSSASGNNAIALGSFVSAKGSYSFAEGNNSEANGAYSVALGSWSKANGDYSFSIGYLSKANGIGSTAMGDGTTADGDYSVAMGYGTSADGIYAFALGYFNGATNHSMAVGTYAHALHEGSFVWGDKTFSNFNSTSNNQFLVRAAGGVGINTNNGSGFALNVRGNVNFNGTVNATNFSGRFVGNGNGLTNLSTPTINNYFFSYDTTTQQVAVAGTFQNISFNTDGQLSGWAHTVPGTDFFGQPTGLYLVQYTAQVEVTNATSSTVTLRATLNGTEISGSQASVDTEIANQSIPVSKSFIVAATSGQTLRLQLTGSSTNNRLIANNGSGTVRPSVSMTVVRIQ